MSTIQDRLHKWEEKALEFYNNGDLGFYNQTPLDTLDAEPQLVICGINPGSEKNEGLFTHEKGFLLAGNPSGWSLKDWNLAKFGINDTIYNANNCVLTNATFFASKHKCEIKKLLADSAPFTLELLRALSSDKIILLSGHEAFPRFFTVKSQGKTSVSVSYKIVSSIPNNKILIGEISGIPTLGIPHPAARKLDCAAIKRVVTAFLNGTTDMQLLQKEYGKCPKAFTAKDVASVLDSRKNLPLYESERVWRYKINNELQLTITSCEKGYCGIRLINAIRNSEGKQTYTSDYFISKVHSVSGWQADNSWCGKKYLREFESLDDCITQIFTIIEKIKSECKD